VLLTHMCLRHQAV